MTPQDRNAIKVGDIIAFTGEGCLSVLINAATYGTFWRGVSHVGIIGEYKGELLLFESTTMNELPCVIQGRPIHGTQAVRLEDRIKIYEGKVWHYPLYRRLFESEIQRLNQFLLEHIGIDYDSIGALRSAGEGFSWIESLFRSESLDSIFCSEWCAAAHREIGMLRTDNVSRWNPNRLVRHERWKKILSKPRRLK